MTIASAGHIAPGGRPARGACAALAALAASGCFSDRGVAIEVDVGATGATSVELFLGKAACDSEDKLAGIACTTLAPPDGTNPLDGNIWFRDAPAPYTVEVTGHAATFQLRADAAIALPIVIAVGYAADPTGTSKHPVATATLRDVAIPVGTARVITTDLVAAGPVQLPAGDTRNLTEDRVMVWRKQSPPSACVVVEHWKAGQHQRDFVVPQDDPDCDDVPAPECNPAAWHGTNGVGGGAFRRDCIRRDQPACMVGAFGCSDDLGKTTSCIAEHDEVCLPDTFCSAACNRFDEPCLRTMPITDMTPRIDCTVPALGALSPCANDRAAKIDLDTHYTGGECDRQPLISSLTLAGFATSASFGGAEMELTSPQKLCNFGLQWKTGPRTAIDPTDFGLIQVSTDHGALLVPLVLHFMPGACGTTPFKCTVLGAADDTLWGCAP